MSKKFLYGFFIIFACGLFAQENKLDQLDKQSEEFFNAITGLEKTYLQEQIKKRKETINSDLNNGRDVVINGNPQNIKRISEDEIKRALLENENSQAKLSKDIAKSKNIQNIVIKGMYKFNGKNYVILAQEDLLQNNNIQTLENLESTMNIEGRYKKGDLILNHRIVYINTRTKTVTLYKKLDDNYGYFIYLNNETISVSDLKKIVKDKTKKQNVKLISVKTDPKFKAMDNCVYELTVPKLNVRADKNLDGTILKVLEKGDKITGKKYENRLLIDTIYRNSNETVKSDGTEYWVGLSTTRFVANKNNCF